MTRRWVVVRPSPRWAVGPPRPFITGSAAVLAWWERARQARALGRVLPWPSNW